MRQSEVRKYMGLTKEQRIYAAIELLEHNGYVVKKDFSSLIGKWVAFRQDGMNVILHGKVCDIFNYEVFKIKCKNGCNRYCSMKNTIEFFDNKHDCYVVKF